MNACSKAAAGRRDKQRDRADYRRRPASNTSSEQSRQSCASRARRWRGWPRASTRSRRWRGTAARRPGLPPARPQRSNAPPTRTRRLQPDRSHTTLPAL